jgi:hypothetical protein
MTIIQRLRMPKVAHTYHNAIAQLDAIAPNNFIVWNYLDQSEAPANDRKPPQWVSGAIYKGVHSTWEQYSDVAEAYHAGGRFAGIGFVLTNSKVICIDIDDCIVDGVIAPYALDAINTFRTYAEVSPSGAGIKIFGTYEGDMQKIGTWATLPGIKIEVYNGRGGFSYMTITGAHIPKSPAKIIEIKYTNYRRFEKKYCTDISYATATASATSIDATPHNEVGTNPPSGTYHATTATATALPGINEARRISRFDAYAPKYWEGAKRNAKASLQSDPQWHNARRRIAFTLGTTLGALHNAATTINASTAWLPTVDTLAAEVYAMRPNDDKQTDTKNEQKTIWKAVDKGYKEGISDWNKAAGNGNTAPQRLADIINDTGHETTATAPAASMQANPPSGTYHAATTLPGVTTPAATALPAAALSIFDAVYNFVAEDEYYATEGELLAHTGHTIGMNYHDLENDKIRKPKPVIANAGSNQHLVMEGTTILSAKSKAGKSTVVLHLAHCVSIGAAAVFGTPSFMVPTSGKVIFFDLENDEGLTADRMREMGLTDNPNFIHVRASTWEQWLTRGIEHGVNSWIVLRSLIGHFMKLYDDVRMIVLDNVLAFEPTPKKGETVADIERQYLMWLRSMSKHYRISVLLVDHNTKAQAGDNEALAFSKAQGTFRKAALLSGGSITIYDAPEKEKDRGQYKVATAPRGTKALTFFLKRDNVAGHHVVSDVEEDLDNVSEAQRRVLDAIRRGNAKMIDIKLYCDPLAEATIKKALSALVAQGLIERSSHGAYAAVETTPALITPPQVPTPSVEDTAAFDASIMEAIRNGHNTENAIVKALPGINAYHVAVRLALLSNSSKLTRTRVDKISTYAIIGT